MGLDEIIRRGKEAQNILNKAKELDNRIHTILSNIKEIDIDKANSLIKNYEITTNYAERILTLLPLKEKVEEKEKRSMKYYPDEKRFQIYQYLISQYFENKKKKIKTPELAKICNLDIMSTRSYLRHNQGLKNIKKNEWEFKKDFLDKTFRVMVNMLLAEKTYIKAEDINKEHAISVGMALARRYKDFRLKRETAIAGVYKYFRK